jgi:hypothetical protein
MMPPTTSGADQGKVYPFVEVEKQQPQTSLLPER